MLVLYPADVLQLIFENSSEISPPNSLVVNVSQILLFGAKQKLPADVPPSSHPEQIETVAPSLLAKYD